MPELLGVPLRHGGSNRADHWLESGHRERTSLNPRFTTLRSIMHLRQSPPCCSTRFIIPGGAESTTALAREPKVVEFIKEAYKHCKPIAVSGESIQLLRSARLHPPIDVAENTSGQVVLAAGVIAAKDSQVGKIAKAFMEALTAHRAWEREAA